MAQRSARAIEFTLCRGEVMKVQETTGKRDGQHEIPEVEKKMSLFMKSAVSRRHLSGQSIPAIQQAEQRGC